MLKSLYIKNYALIDDVSIQFNAGFTSITGETGAGKSILIGALSLLLGKRADYAVLRDDTKKCIVEGFFDLSRMDVAGFFRQHDLDFDAKTLIRREIVPSGRSRAFINDTPVNLDVLSALAEKLVDIHSQHETLNIGKSVFQMNVLDDFIAHPDLIGNYREAYTKLVDLSERFKKLSAESEQSKRDEDYFRFQFDELNAAGLVEGEDENLLNREKLLTHAEEVLQGVSLAKQMLSEGENTVLDQLKDIRSSLLKIEKFHPALGEIVQRIESARIELEDVSAGIDQMDLVTDFDPDELNRISERLNAIYKLEQKHHVDSVSALLALQADYAEKLASLDRGEEHLKLLKSDLQKAQVEAEKIALIMHDERMKEAPVLASSVKAMLVKLGMKDAGFEVKVEKLDRLSQFGTDRIRFLFSANAGGKLQEIAEVASGGELSRLMLAIKSQITRGQLLPTVVFDEIDSGVSGEIAGKVGNIIKNMATRHQVIAITHLPQIAAKADEHFKVYKLTENGKTKTHIKPLDNSSRIEEIAKLLSDEKVTEATLTAARELLKV